MKITNTGKRIISITLAVVMAVSLLPGMSVVTKASPSGTAISSSDSLPTSSGTYYLNEDISLTDTWSGPTGETTLDLNDHTITQTAVADVIQISSGASLTLTDSSSGGTGTVTHASSTSGRGVFILNSGAFTMTGGSITGNTATQYGGGVFVDSGTFTMSSGTIKSNTSSKTSTSSSDAQSYGGGVYVNSSNAYFCVSGNPVITGNTNDSSASNVCAEGNYNAANIYITGQLGDNAKIGITKVSSGGCVGYGLITATESGYISYNDISKFTSDTDTYVLGKNSDGQLYMGHSVKFDANGHGTAPDTQTIPTGTTATKPSDLSATGYTFGGWYTDSDCTNAFDFDTALTSDITLYAKWTANTYTVKFDANGGSGSMADEMFTYDTAQALTANAFTRDGFTFSGWATAASGSAVSGADRYKIYAAYCGIFKHKAY